MPDEILNEIKIKQMTATALKQEAEAHKIQHDLKISKIEYEKPFYKQKWFIKSLAAGFLLFSFLMG